ncbi:hypothetical protein CFOLD11_08980 [Clostridium folliculivorans]|uniref:Uncharacterized protein n=1 Tax=Clostridium folliculivorans TaxID=2886038 RepID=A0A9W5Y035_9CLOT|nr:hypothetical protein [Clostridium folliculivorans]GKU24072.1 hypothetical protein CFOLD11_08980 [Clostridium folliculivorans]
MSVFIIERCNQVVITEVIAKLYVLLGDEVFKRCFHVILIDNSSKFKKTEDLELDAESNQRTKIFYCNPTASYQKPHLEKNHEYISYVILK